ncbi:very short patch repair endonuclease [Desulfotomaculum nigrificans]|uniref:very short patch repair endonuclease n=1 Tax=Desulfotomaculum nigrificans TaxID=1565 RepID=UPI0001FAEB2A|nr:very short patch repair endonuclease [Desulfotomaculum nigrificans]
MDNKSKEERSRNMAAVKNKNTDLEIRLRKALWNEGLRYRIKNNLPGRPDIVFPGKKVAVFCDGCFWHGCPKCGQIPEQNRDFWLAKIEKNKLNDIKVTQRLEQAGWKVKRYWGCEIKKELNRVVKDLKETLNGED